MSLVNTLKSEVKKQKLRLDMLLSGDSLPEQRARHEIIRERRGAFKWLPALCSNDLVHGSWWFVYGSILCIFIPCIPLAAIYEKLWETDDKAEELNIPQTDHVACYALLIFIGILYTIGSYAFLRAVETPPVPPLFSWKHFGSDELFGMWCFFLGTLPSVPLMAIYVAYNTSSQSFFLALLLAILFSILTFLAVLACYPPEESVTDDEEEGREHMHWIYVMCPCLRRQEYLAPMCLCCIPSYFSTLRKHLGTDWLIVSWGLLVGCISSDVICLGLLLYSIRHNDGRGIFDYSTGLVDMILFTVGSMYFLAGSYPEQAVAFQDTKGSISECCT